MYRKITVQRSFKFKSKKVQVIELPLSSTEDRVIGTIDLEYAIKEGKCKFEPGILAKANKNIIYVDEINLLDDPIVDVLLDSAAMRVNTVEREGVSYSHPANFILVGTMNPEEGELRPQLLDRFGFCVNIIGIANPEKRVEVIKRRAAFEEDSNGFCRKWESEQDKIRIKIKEAKEILPKVELSDEMLYLIADISIQMGVDGHRADLIMMKSAKTMAAFNGRKKVTEEDIRESVDLTLMHRMRRKPFEKLEVDGEKLNNILVKNS
ncbi:ATP-binding protein [Clostridium tepidum]|jgi:magnesium chelatase subunit I|uniref:ATP-binding protein n=1 Tax=Clostridium tepidum TaxID=1962263 RepID=UPI001FABE732|nr:AAA family ATPase [Clostridium tepidum]MCR1935095.1 AAA family ATPase [Clostridium tepidum]